MFHIISGGKHKDIRGTVAFVNDFDMKEVRRMYCIEQPDITTIRAWQGHKKEQKWFFVTTGKFKIGLIVPDNWENPSRNLEPVFIELCAEEPKILHIPGGYVNGFRALKPISKMMVFSDFSIEESKADDYRYDMNYWNWKD
jgi:dTDP-4-dehydrorhamnose 3,5-epimerase-like enzyme